MPIEIWRADFRLLRVGVQIPDPLFGMQISAILRLSMQIPEKCWD